MESLFRDIHQQIRISKNHLKLTPAIVLKKLNLSDVSFTSKMFILFRTCHKGCYQSPEYLFDKDWFYELKIQLIT